MREWLRTQCGKLSVRDPSHDAEIASAAALAIKLAITPCASLQTRRSPLIASLNQQHFTVSRDCFFNRVRSLTDIRKLHLQNHLLLRRTLELSQEARTTRDLKSQNTLAKTDGWPRWL